MMNLPSQSRRRRGLAAVVTATFVLAGCGTQGSAENDPTAESTPASQSPSEPEESEEPTVTVAAPIYFVGEAGGKDRLFREFREVQGVTLTEAARLVDGGMPLDTDYRTLWPGGTVLSAEAGRKVITVQLNGDISTGLARGMKEGDAQLAIQQMVRTLQGVEQSQAPVRFVRPAAEPAADEEGAPETQPGAEPSNTLFGIDITEPFRASKWNQSLAMVNVTVPTQGQAVSGDVLDAEGVASSPEANVPWQILREDEVVLEGYATADGWMDALHPWATSIDVSELAPGDYTFVASTDDPSDGERGARVTSDSKDFTLD
ncbi:Gmad2 immunoglobulin-like domain-containing protein [Nocardioides gilvus]|uniref:Gmad2 immunoglobulin-like domain-containing protein n=1 Tax=Nocardioides gilvus TaxID=1735589 RepID=UPI000D747EF7|nr:Gmad2 immunoglobulin-like domain-containing protein [Nocardioides gilvus]